MRCRCSISTCLPWAFCLAPHSWGGLRYRTASFTDHQNPETSRGLGVFLFWIGICQWSVVSRLSSFGFRISLVIRHSSFVIRHSPPPALHLQFSRPSFPWEFLMSDRVIIFDT